MDSISQNVQQKYGQAALEARAGRKADCGCATSCCSAITSNLYDETEAAAIPAEAMLASLGCGNPTALAALKPGEEKVYRIAMAVADSPLAAYGIVASLNGPAGEVSGTVLAPDKSPAPRASLLVSINGESLPGYPDAKGAYSFRLPVGQHRIKVEDIGRDPLDVVENQQSGL